MGKGCGIYLYGDILLRHVAKENELYEASF